MEIDIYAMPVRVSSPWLFIDSRDAIESLNPAAEELFGYPAAMLIGQGIDKVIVAFPDEPPGHALLGGISLPGNAADGGLALGRHRSGSVFPLLALRQTTNGRAAIRLQRVMPTRFGSSAANRDELDMENRRLMILNGLLRPSWTNIPLEQQLEHALDAILALPGFPAETSGAIYLLDADGSLALRVMRGLPAATARHCQCASKEANLRESAGPTTKIAILPGLDRGRRATPECLHEARQYGVPILNNDRLFGLLTVAAPRRDRDWPMHAECLWLVAETLSALIERIRTEEENFRLLNENRRLNRRLISILEDERRRLARELHDDFGQSLTAIKTDAALILGHCRDAPSLLQSAKAISTAADHLYDANHALIRQLRPGALDDLSLVAALESCVYAWRQRRPGMGCNFVADGEFDNLGEEINITIYRVVQECLTNVIRHAAASRVDIRLGRARNQAGVEEVCLQVRDDGRGMDPNTLRTKNRFGLLGIRERVEGLGGRLTLVSQAGQGLRISACIPIHAEPVAGATDCSDPIGSG